MDNLKSEVEHPTRPCSKQWEAYQKALAEVVEARKKAEPYIVGQNSDSAGDWLLTRALEANQKADDAFKAWRDCIRAHPLL